MFLLRNRLKRFRFYVYQVGKDALNRLIRRLVKLRILLLFLARR